MEGGWGSIKGIPYRPTATPYPWGAHWKWSFLLFAQGPFYSRSLEVAAGPKIAGRWEKVAGDRVAGGGGGLSHL